MPEEFAITLETPPVSELRVVTNAHEYAEDLDDVRSLLHDLCSALEEQGSIRFVVEFAGERWPTDVRTDLTTVLEQMPDVARGISEAFEIDFFEQGLERTLHFTAVEGEVEVA